MSTPTPSLRGRVTATVLGLFALLLVLVVVLVDVALGARLTQDLQLRLSDRVLRAQQLSDAGAAPPELVSLLQGQDIRVRVVTADGDSYGDPGLGPLGPPAPADPPRGAAGSAPAPSAPASGRPAPARPGGGAPPARGTGGIPGPPTPPAATSTTVTRTLSDGSTLVLVGDTTSITDVRTQLRWLMAAAAVGALLVAAFVLVLGVGTALRPLDRMTALARRITAGDRGTRLDPDRPGSELGRAAAAFDGMLDALEDAETRARASAAETRGFLSDAAHELRTPLAGIQALAESIAHAPGADQRQRRRARLLMSETGRAARLVADMLDLARIEEGVALEIADIDLVAVVAAEVERVRVLAPGTAVTTSGPETLRLRADAARVGQIMTNLLDNARRHTPPDGRISVAIGPGAEVVVANTGPTIAEEDRERIFGRLVRLQESRDRDSGGAGLGLPVARGLARAHGGDLVCEPAEGGASFRLTLPA